MAKMKYIRLKSNDLILLFPMQMDHHQFVLNMRLKKEDIASAGFVGLVKELNNHFKNPGFECYGHSYSLGLKSKTVDTRLLNRQFYGNVLD